jgi:hypothetical protein
VRKTVGRVFPSSFRIGIEKATRQAILRWYRLPRTDVSLKMVELRGVELEGNIVSATKDEFLALPSSGRGRR